MDTSRCYQKVEKFCCDGSSCTMVRHISVEYICSLSQIRLENGSGRDSIENVRESLGIASVKLLSRDLINYNLLLNDSSE